MAGDELVKRGWRLTSEGQEQCTDNGNKSADAISKNALNLDLKDIGEKWLPTGLNTTGRAKVDYVTGPAVLQILKLRNISAPKDNEESQAAPRLWKITLTDGHANMVAICLEPLRNINLLTPPGTKLLLEGAVDVESSYLLLTNKNARLLGGRVPNLVEPWELKRNLAEQSRLAMQSEGNPPPFVPFGKKIATVDVPRKDNFKSLATNKQNKEEEDSEFQQLRQATIAEALTIKRAKTFGGGQKPFLNDRDVTHIVQMGFSPTQAATALRQCGGNVHQAIGSLLGGRDGGYDMSRGGGGGVGGGRGGFGGGRGVGGLRDRGDSRGDRFEEDREDSRRGGRGGGRGVGRRGRGDRGGDEEEAISSRPSGPATLFDFLETKIPSKAETQQASNNVRVSSSSGPNQRSSSLSSHQPASQRTQHTTSNGSYTPRSNPPAFNSNSHPPPPPPPPSSHANSRPGGSSYRDSPAASSSRSSDTNHFHHQSSDSGYRPSDHGGGGAGRDFRGGGGYHNEDFNPGRRQQNLPPRLANKMSRDGGSSGGGSGGGGGGGFSQGGGNSRPPNVREQDCGQENRTRYGGGGPGPGPDHPNADRRFLIEQHNSNLRNNHYVVDQQQPSPKPFGQPGPYPGMLGGGGQRPRFDQQRPLQQQQHEQHGPPPPRRQNGPVRPVWQRGQTVLAKYWEDDQLYRAVVEAVAENGATAVVTFLDYGNQEEVMCSDIHPFPPLQNWNNSYPPPHPPPPHGAPLMPTPGFFPPGYGPAPPNMGPPPPQFPGQEGFGSGPIPNMEFRRGGSGPGTHRRPDQMGIPPDRRRPTQNFYTPPSRKKEG